MIKDYFLLKQISKKNPNLFYGVLWLFIFEYKKFRRFKKYISQGMSIKFALEKAHQSNKKLITGITVAEQTDKAVEILNEVVIPQNETHMENTKRKIDNLIQQQKSIITNYCDSIGCNECSLARYDENDKMVGCDSTDLQDKIFKLEDELL